MENEQKYFFEIYDNNQFLSILYLKDELIHVYDEMRFAKGIDTKAFLKLKTRLERMNQLIDSYVKKSENCFPIVCLEDQVIEPQDKCELKTNVIGIHLDDAKVVFDGSIPSAGYLQLSYENKEWGTNIYAKNNMPREALENWDVCGYHYNNPMTTRYFAPGVYQIEKNTTVGIGLSKDKELVKTIKKHDSFKI